MLYKEPSIVNNKILRSYRIMELSKTEIGKIIRGVKHGRIQLKMEKSSSSPQKDILCTLIVNGQVQRNYICCCICKEILKKGESNNACRRKHISKHYWKGDLVGPLILAQIVDNFNMIHGQS